MPEVLPKPVNQAPKTSGLTPVLAFRVASSVARPVRRMSRIGGGEMDDFTSPASSAATINSATAFCAAASLALTSAGISTGASSFLGSSAFFGSSAGLAASAFFGSSVLVSSFFGSWAKPNGDQARPRINASDKAGVANRRTMILLQKVGDGPTRRTIPRLSESQIQSTSDNPNVNALDPCGFRNAST